MDTSVPLAKRVLIVDDNAEILESLAMVLELLGHHVETVDNGEAALVCLAQRPPHVALIDVGMPGMSGYDVARRARALVQPEHHTVLVAMTGWGRDEDRVRAFEAGFDSHVVKPVDLQRLRALLDGTVPHADGRRRRAAIQDVGPVQRAPGT
jgi:CheY-like chemotaxis protein